MLIKQQNTSLTNINLDWIYTVKTVILHFIVTFLNLNTTVKSYFICNFVILYLSMLDLKKMFYCLFPFLMTVHLIMFEHLLFAVVLKTYLSVL